MSTTIHLEESKEESNNEGYQIGEVDYPVVKVVTSQPGLYPKIVPTAPTLEEIDPVGNQQSSYPTETVPTSTLEEHPPKEDDSILTPQNVNPVVIEEGFVRMWISHWREILAILPGLVIIFGSSHHTAWAIHKWLLYEYWMPAYVFCGILIWFAGAVIGSVLGASLVPITKKRYIYFIGSLLLGIAGFLHAIDFSSTYLYIDRLLCGASFGIANLTVIIHASDITSKNMRDFALKCITLTMALSLVVFQLLYGMRLYSSSSEKVGHVLIYFSGLASILLFLSSESIPFLIVRGETAKAMQRLTEYNCESTPSDKAKCHYDELKSVIDEEKLKSKNVFSADNLRPLVIVGSARLLNVLSSSIFILLMILINVRQLPASSYFINSTAYVFFFAFRLIFGLVGLCLTRFTNRYHFYHGLAFLSGIFLFTTLLPFQFWGSFSFFNLLLAFGLDALKNVQVAEQFPMNKRPWSIVVGDALEHITHVLLLVLYNFGYVNFITNLTGFGLIAASVVLHKVMDKDRKEIIARN